MLAIGIRPIILEQAPGLPIHNDKVKRSRIFVRHLVTVPPGQCAVQRKQIFQGVASNGTRWLSASIATRANRTAILVRAHARPVGVRVDRLHVLRRLLREGNRRERGHGERGECSEYKLHGNSNGSKRKADEPCIAPGLARVRLPTKRS